MNDLRTPPAGGSYLVDEITGEFVKIEPTPPVAALIADAPVAGDLPKLETKK